ncbi:uncharacterized protein [Aegilops tauschii subsp. strangulata]
MHGGIIVVAVLGADLSAKISRAMAALLRLLRTASPGGKAPWSEVPPEMLAHVLSCLPSHTDRVRLRAVCRAWRSAAHLHPLPPPLPWFFLRGDTFVTLPNGARHRIRRPLDCKRTLSSFPTGSMLFLVHSNDSCYLMNPCSGETNPLHIARSVLPIDLDSRNYNWIRKVVVSDRIVTVPHSGMITIFRRTARACHCHCADQHGLILINQESQWKIFCRRTRLCLCPPASTPVATDIALFQGELYSLTKKRDDNGSELPELHRLEIGDEHTPVRSVQYISGTPRNGVPDPAGLPAGHKWRFSSYLVGCGVQLLMVERRTVDQVPLPAGRSRPMRTQFEVWEAVNPIGGSHGRWSKVNVLMGHALFVSRGCSQSLPAAAQCGAREDCIYSVTEYDGFVPRRLRKHEDDVLNCVVATS